jgi:hypothetical protein
VHRQAQLAIMIAVGPDAADHGSLWRPRVLRRMANSHAALRADPPAPSASVMTCLSRLHRPVSYAAPHNDCRSWSEELHTCRLGTQYRVAAECTSINSADKARGVLDLAGQIDVHTDWFTQPGVVYHSSWQTPLSGVRGTRMEYAPRLRRREPCRSPVICWPDSRVPAPRQFTG